MLVERTSYWTESDLGLVLFFFSYIHRAQGYLFWYPFTLLLYANEIKDDALFYATLSLCLNQVVATLMPYYSLPDYPNICITNFLELYRVYSSQKKRYHPLLNLRQINCYSIYNYFFAHQQKDADTTLLKFISTL